jgi:alkylation response protein AidB-like acyl-CoA dehydrogenase
VAGSLRPEGQASPVDGGYRIRGCWDFASGIRHANWLLCTCSIMDGDAPRQTPVGVPETRSMLIPVDAATIVDTWSVVGLCGTGSHDFSVDDVFVPASHSFSLGRDRGEARRRPRLRRASGAGGKPVRPWCVPC